jgi:photosystem II stability/assembly factor-like uncharacterized protein
MIKRSTQSTACEGSERCPEKDAPRRYCRHVVFLRSVPRHRRSPRHGGGFSLLLVAVTLMGSGCTLSGHPAVPPSPQVLGEPKVTPLAVGQPAPAGTGELGAVSCANARRCWAVGVAGPNPAPAGVSTVVIVATTNGGTSWKAQQVAGGSTPQLSGISCPTPTECMAVGSNGASLPGSGVVVTTTDAGATWSPALSPPSALAVSSVACASPTECTVIVTDGTVSWSDQSSDLGQSWQQKGGLPSPFLAGNDLTCVPGGSCLVAGYVPTSNGHGEGAVALSADGGQTWALAKVPAGIGLLQSVACLSVFECLAGGTTNTTVSDVVPAKGELLSSTDGGHTWQTSARPVPVDDVFGVACPSARQCAMVGTRWFGFPAIATGAVAQSLDGGQTFRISPTAYTPITLTAVSCPTTTGCVAVGEDTVARLTLLRPKPPPVPSRSPG